MLLLPVNFLLAPSRFDEPTRPVATAVAPFRTFSIDPDDWRTDK